MHDEPHANDDVLFDRLVDGELSADERRRLLASLDDRPGGWRQCATAFLEAQTWKQQFGQIVRKSQATGKLARASADGSTGPRHSIGLWTLAASLFIAFTLGLALRDNVFPLRSPGPNQAAQIAAADARPGNPTRPNGQAGDVVTFWVRDDTGRAQPLRVPLVDARTLDSQLGMEFQSGLPADVRDRLRRDGYDVQSKRRYAPLWMDGRPMVVPVEDTRVVPVSQTVY
jgi:hypothetical protein